MIIADIEELGRATPGCRCRCWFLQAFDDIIESRMFADRSLGLDRGVDRERAATIITRKWVGDVRMMATPNWGMVHHFQYGRRGRTHLPSSSMLALVLTSMRYSNPSP